MLEFATGPGFFKVLQDRAIALVDDAVKARRDRRGARPRAARGRAGGARGIEAGESTADRWQLEQRIRHAENQLSVVGRGTYWPDLGSTPSRGIRSRPTGRSQLRRYCDCPPESFEGSLATGLPNA